MSDRDQWALVIAWSVMWATFLVGALLADSSRARSCRLSRVFDDMARGLEAGAQLLLALVERGVRRVLQQGHA